METVIAAREIKIERKKVTVQLAVNARGEFLRVTESSAGKDNTVIIPRSGIADFCNAVAEVARESV